MYQVLSGIVPVIPKILKTLLQFDSAALKMAKSLFTIS